MANLSSTAIIILNVVFSLFGVIAGSLPFLLPYLKSRKTTTLKDFIAQNKTLFLVSLALAIGFYVRIAFISVLPYGLNQDEAASGYDAYAILTSGMDRNGTRLPVHLISWGSGQNAFYTYLCIPFVFLLGLNALSLRLPMAILSCLSLYLFYKLLKSNLGEKIALIGLAVFALCPWDIMRSRWGLESNAFPSLALLALYLLSVAINSKKILPLLSSAAVFGLSAYSYGTSYFFLFFFVIAAVIYLFAKKLISLQRAALYVLTVGVVALPIMIFIYINVFDKEAVTFLGFTIPKLLENRFQTVTNLFGSDFFLTAANNFFYGLQVIFTQSDGLTFNALPVFGTVYLLSTPFTLFGLFHKDEEHKTLVALFRLWLLVSLLMLFIISPNINRINVVFIPLVFFTCLGLYDVLKNAERLKRVAITLYALMFIGFSTVYVNSFDNECYNGFYGGYGEAIAYANSIEADNYYMTRSVNMSYIFVLFYTQYDVNDFIETVNYNEDVPAFRFVESFGKYVFHLPSNLTSGNVYVVAYSDAAYAKYDLDDRKVAYFNNYCVIDMT